MTAADVTFAALAAPVVLPPECCLVSAFSEAGVEMPPESLTIAKRFRETPAGKHCLYMVSVLNGLGPPFGGLHILCAM